MEKKWIAAFAVAVANDILDWIGIGMIPLVGDALDAAAAALLWKLIGRRKAVFTLVELIPGADILPIHTATVIWAYYREEPRRLKKTLKKIDIR